MDPQALKSLTKGEKFTFQFEDTASGVTYTPWTDGYAVGFKCQYGNKTEYVYLNPSSTGDSTGEAADKPNIFLYVGKAGKPAEDTALTHTTVFWGE